MTSEQKDILRAANPTAISSGVMEQGIQDENRDRLEEVSEVAAPMFRQTIARTYGGNMPFLPLIMDGVTNVTDALGRQSNGTMNEMMQAIHSIARPAIARGGNAWDIFEKLFRLEPITNTISAIIDAPHKSVLDTAGSLLRGINPLVNIPLTISELVTEGKGKQGGQVPLLQLLSDIMRMEPITNTVMGLKNLGSDSSVADKVTSFIPGREFFRDISGMGLSNGGNAMDVLMQIVNMIPTDQITTGVQAFDKSMDKLGKFATSLPGTAKDIMGLGQVVENPLGAQLDQEKDERVREAREVFGGPRVRGGSPQAKIQQYLEYAENMEDDEHRLPNDAGYKGDWTQADLNELGDYVFAGIPIRRQARVQSLVGSGSVMKTLTDPAIIDVMNSYIRQEGPRLEREQRKLMQMSGSQFWDGLGRHIKKEAAGLAANFLPGEIPDEVHAQLGKIARDSIMPTSFWKHNRHNPIGGGISAPLYDWTVHKCMDIPADVRAEVRSIGGGYAVPMDLIEDPAYAFDHLDEILGLKQIGVTDLLSKIFGKGECGEGPCVDGEGVKKVTVKFPKQSKKSVLTDAVSKPGFDWMKGLSILGDVAVPLIGNVTKSIDKKHEREAEERAEKEEYARKIIEGEKTRVSKAEADEMSRRAKKEAEDAEEKRIKRNHDLAKDMKRFEKDLKKEEDSDEEEEDEEARYEAFVKNMKRLGKGSKKHSSKGKMKVKVKEETSSSSSDESTSSSSEEEEVCARGKKKSKTVRLTKAGKEDGRGKHAASLPRDGHGRFLPRSGVTKDEEGGNKKKSRK